MATPATRLGRDERREALLDAAAALIAEGSLDDVSMDAVAERAGVSRPLVYKHFANREQVLVELFAREAKVLHQQMTAVVVAAESIEEMFRALVRSALRASVERGPLFAALRGAGAGIREVGRQQLDRDRVTSRAFARRAETELGIDARTAAMPIGLLLGLIDQVLVQFRANPTPSRAEHLEDSYMTIVSATLSALRESGA
jgi:AcrR family transcriptional regulator